MKILFINTNQIVQKLVEVTAQKANVELQTVSDPSQVGDIDQYDYIIVDDGCYNMDKAAYDALISGRRACLIYSKHEEMSKGFSEYIKKPFIPTHILEIMVAQIAKVQTKEAFSQNPDSPASPSSLQGDSQEDLTTNTDDNSLQSSPLEHLKALSEEYHLTDEESNIAISEDTEQTSALTEIGKDDILGDLNLDDIDLGDVGLEGISLDEADSKSPTQETKPTEDTIDEDTQAQSTDTELTEAIDSQALDSTALDIESTDSQPTQESKDNEIESIESTQSQDESVHDENLALDTQDIDLGDVDLENADLGDMNLEDMDTIEATEHDNFESQAQETSIEELSELSQDSQDLTDSDNAQANDNDDIQIKEVDLSSTEDTEDQGDLEDFQSLAEQDVLRAVGEDTGSQDTQEPTDTTLHTTEDTQEIPKDTNKDLEVVTNAISQSIQDSIKRLQSPEVTALLDGMEVTINISFKDTHK
ncbi:hypothetical protein [uncultured Helicobacter sp.]|uniref:hypothetical protein n=1 Tax=uncultured Helicobacter sp. TaxID=175537 RepID=UPI00374EC5EC